MTGGTGTTLEVSAVLAALMDRVGQRVRVSVCASQQPRPVSHVMDIEGTLAAGWDPTGLPENGVDDGAIFGLEEVDAFALYLVRDDFRDAAVRADRIVIFTGGVAVVVQPPFQDLAPA